MKRSFLVGGIVASALVSAALAQTVEGLDLQAIQERATSTAETLKGFLGESNPRADAAKDDASAASEAAFIQMKALDASSLPGEPGGTVDLDELIAGSKQLFASQKSAPMFIAFASLSMPEKSLKTMIDDVRRAGGVVVFRGFPGNNAKLFSASILKVVDRDTQANVAIDPRLFRAFDVTAAPTYIAVSTDFTPCENGFDCKSDVPPHDRLVGNVTVRFALNRFVEGRGPGAAVAAVALKKFEGAE